MSELPSALGGGAVVLLFTLLARWLAAYRRRRRTHRRARAARAGELAAVELLAGAGFAVEDVQVARAWSMTVDGVTHDAKLRCDYLATRDGERWVAEVKTGREAPRLANIATRRQLLEYQVAYDAAGVALVDATQGLVHEVRFALDDRPASSAAPAWPAFVAGALVGLLAGLALVGAR